MSLSDFLTITLRERSNLIYVWLNCLAFRCRFLPFLVVAIFAYLFQLGCRGERENPTKSAGLGLRGGGKVVIGWTTDLECANPLISFGSSASDEIFSRVFLHLMEEQPDFAQHPPTLVPQLARSYDWSNDHKILTFSLRDDVTWSDGVPVTAEDVKWTLEVQKNRAIAWDKAYMKEAITQVDAVDPHTVRFHFSHVYAKQLLDVNEGVILPMHAWKAFPVEEWRKNPSWFRDHLVVDGPFTIDKWEAKKRIILKRNDHYYKKSLPYLASVEFLILSDQEKIVDGLFQGTVDFTPQVSPRDVKRIRADSRLEVIAYWHRLVVAIAWNNQRPPFDRPEVRRALTMGIDRKAIVDAVFGSEDASETFGRLATSPIVGSAWAHSRKITALPFDANKARQVLATQGFKIIEGNPTLDGNGKPFTFELATNLGNLQRGEAALMVRDQLKQLGIQVRPLTIGFGDLLTLMKAANFDAAILGLTMDTSLDLTGAYDSRSIQEGENYARYSNPEVDRWMRRAMERANILDSRGDLDHIQEILNHDQPYTLLWESQRLNAVNRRVHDVRPNAISSLFNLEEWWVDQP
jgi:peptide/nickel transport system substrate-binding protein